VHAFRPTNVVAGVRDAHGPRGTPVPSPGPAAPSPFRTPGTSPSRRSLATSHGHVRFDGSGSPRTCSRMLHIGSHRPVASVRKRPNCRCDAPASSCTRFARSFSATSTRSSWRPTVDRKDGPSPLPISGVRGPRGPRVGEGGEDVGLRTIHFDVASTVAMAHRRGVAALTSHLRRAFHASGRAQAEVLPNTQATKAVNDALRPQPSRLEVRWRTSECRRIWRRARKRGRTRADVWRRCVDGKPRCRPGCSWDRALRMPIPGSSLP